MSELVGETMSAECLTQNLSLELEKTNQLFTRWCGDRQDLLNANTATYRQLYEEMECTLRALQENESQLELARASNDKTKQEQSEEIAAYMENTEKLKKYKKELELQLMKCEVDVEKEQIRLKNAKQEHDLQLTKMEKAMNDLTQGIRLYMSLGLEFQKAEGECMKFISTQIDPRDPARQFYFLMYVDSNDRFQLVESNPVLDNAYTMKHLEVLNMDNNVGKFVAKMRKAYVTLANK